MRNINAIRAKVREHERANPYVKPNNATVYKFRGQDCVFLGVFSTVQGEEEKALVAIKSKETGETIPVVLPLGEIVFNDNELEIIFNFLPPIKK